MDPTTQQPTLVLGGTRKTGRRVVQRLESLDLAARIGTPSSVPSFDWTNPTTWSSALDGVGSVYLTYYRDLAVPGARAAVRSFAELAVRRGVPRLVLLSGRGEPEAEQAERAVRDTGAELTVLRSTWFMQNFSEDYMLEHVLGGELRLPAGQVPTSLTMAEAAAEIAQASGRRVRYVPVSLEEHAAEAAAHGVPPEVVELLTYLIREVMDGRNAATTDDVRRALGREPRDFGDYARAAAATGVWGGSAAAA